MNTDQSDAEMIVQTTREPIQQLLKKAAGIEQPKRQKKKQKTIPFRPLNRQPLAKLTVLDDGSREQGEEIRIRQPVFVIGREKGDLTLPFDHDISGQHVELRCQNQHGKFRWYIIDKSSRNGTFLRAYRATLSKEVELILGNRRYAFQAAQIVKGVHEMEVVETQAYQAPSVQELNQLHSRFSEVGADNPNSNEFVLKGNEYLIGRDPDCEIRIVDEPFLSPKHAKLSKDERGRWMIADTKSLNGVWIRVQRMALDRQAEIQIGQQRFLFQPQMQLGCA